MLECCRQEEIEGMVGGADQFWQIRWAEVAHRRQDALLSSLEAREGEDLLHGQGCSPVQGVGLLLGQASQERSQPNQLEAQLPVSY